MLTRPFLSSLLIVGSVFLLANISSPAFAGFQWVAPSTDTQTYQPAPVTPVAPKTTQQQPVIIQAPTTVSPSLQPVTRAPQAQPLPTENSSKPVAASSQFLQLPEEKVQVANDHTLKAPTSSLPASTDSDKIVRGFANNVPLAVALRQILPSEYGFSAAQDVKLTTIVSWQGGRTWRPILDDMLASVGLAMREQGKMINIIHAAGAPTASYAGEPTSSAPQPLPTQTLKLPAETRSLTVENKPVTLLAPVKTEKVLVPPPAAAVVAMPVQQPIPAAGPTVDTWTAGRGDTLHKIVEGWCRRAGVELSWQAEYDYPLQATVTLTGTFEEAVRNLLTGFQEAQPQPVGTLYNSSAAGQTVLVIQTRGNNYGD